MTPKRKCVWMVQGPPTRPGLLGTTYGQLAGTYRVTEFRKFEDMRAALLVARKARP